MDRPRDCHTKWSKTKTNIIWYQLFVESKKKKKIQKLTKQKQTHRLKKQTYCYQRGKVAGWEGIN